MNLPEFGVRRPVFTAMIFLGIIILGVAALLMLPIDLLPDIEMPTMAVITFYGGASPEDVEEKVTKIIEGRISTVPNLKKVKSVSQEDFSAVSLQFEWGTDLAEAANDVRQGIDMAARYLPDDVDKPILIKMDFSMMPIMVMGITAQESYEDLIDLVDQELCDPLKRLPGVATTTTMGGLHREIQINLDRQRLEAYHLSPAHITEMLAAENVTQPAGDLEIGSCPLNIADKWCSQ